VVGTAHLPSPTGEALAAAFKAAVGESRTFEHVAKVSAAIDAATRLGRARVVVCGRRRWCWWGRRNENLLAY